MPVERHRGALRAVESLRVPMLLCLLAAAAAAAADEPPVDGAAGLYSTRPPSRDGIGKVYMGREISFVLGHHGIPWLERAERESEERPDLLVENMGLAPDAVVADLGAGSGYFTFRISPQVPRGRVLAVDIQREMLDFVAGRRDELGVENVETVLGTITDPRLPEASVDAVLLVDVYHEFSHPREMMEAVFRALKPGGKVFLVEYRAEDPEVPMLPLHKMTQAQAKKELHAAGLEWVETLDNLPMQHFMVFRRPPGN